MRNRIVWSCETGIRKPLAEAFDIALEGISVSKKFVLVVGDDETADIQGARAAGIKSMRVFDARPENSAADYLVSREEIISKLLPLTCGSNGK